MLKDHGKPVVDSVWGEWLLDIRTPAKRTALARIMGRWTDRCARDGFDAVEYDNLDSFSRSHHLLTRADAKAYAALLVDARASRTASRPPRRTGPSGTARRVGFDFAVAEQCGQYRECGSYVDHYGEPRAGGGVPRRRRSAGPAPHWSDRIAVVRRDVDLTRHGVRRWC